MTITIGWWAIPLVVSLILFLIMTRPNRNAPSGGGWWSIDPTPLFRMLWLIPILLTWIVYLAIVALTK